MSIVIGCLLSDRVILMGDGRGIVDDQIVYENIQKVVNYNNKILFGGTGAKKLLDKVEGTIADYLSLNEQINIINLTDKIIDALSSDIPLMKLTNSQYMIGFKTKNKFGLFVYTHHNDYKEWTGYISDHEQLSPRFLVIGDIIGLQTIDKMYTHERSIEENIKKYIEYASENRNSINNNVTEVSITK